ERVERTSATSFYISQGRQAYRFVSEHARSRARDATTPYRRLAERFESYASVLDYTRRVHFFDAPTHPFFRLLFDCPSPQPARQPRGRLGLDIEFRTALRPSRRLLVGLTQAEGGRLVERATDELYADGQSRDGEPTGDREDRKAEGIERAREARKAAHALDHVLRGAGLGVGQRWRRLGDARGDQHIHLREDLRDDLAGEAGPQSGALEVIVGGHTQTRGEAREDGGLELARALLEDPRVNGRGLGGDHGVVAG